MYLSMTEKINIHNIKFYKADSVRIEYVDGEGVCYVVETPDGTASFLYADWVMLLQEDN